MKIRTLEGRVLFINDSVELQRVDETIDGEKRFCIYLVNINEPSKSILLHYADNEKDSFCVYCQAIGLMRSRNTEMLDFEAMETNPDKYDYQSDSISWEKKLKQRENSKKRVYKKF